MNIPFESLLSKLPVVFWTTDPRFQVTWSIGPELPPNLSAYHKALAGRTENYVTEYSGFSYEVTVMPLKDQADQIVGIVGMALDVTERKILENQLRSSQKMEALGRIAGGIAHDFNNILTVIMNYAELLEMDLGNNPQVKSKLDAISNCASKAAGLTNQILAFTKQQVIKQQEIDLNVLLTSVGQMLHRVIGEDVEFKLNLKENLPRISADPNQILHVIMSLAHQARESMPAGGVFTLQTSTQSDSVLISAKHTGLPVDPKTQGSNLNLASIAGMVKQNQGSFEIQSSSFEISFPALGNKAVGTESGPENRQESPETILVVEDEDIVRQVACDIIRSSGYNVVEATNALNALELCENSTAPIDLVLTDLIMPKMNGPELIRKLSLKFPSINVVYMSGYNSETALGEGLLKEKASFIQKPFMPKSLLKIVRDTLDGQVVASA